MLIKVDYPNKNEAIKVVREDSPQDEVLSLIKFSMEVSTKNSTFDKAETPKNHSL